MNPMKWLAAWSLLAAAAMQQDPVEDKEAAELLRKVEEKVMQVKSLHVEFEFGPEAVRSRSERMKGELKIGEGGAFQFNLTSVRRRSPTAMSVQSDGRVIKVKSSSLEASDTSAWKPADFEKLLRRMASQSMALGSLVGTRRATDLKATYEELAPKEAKIEKKEKVGEVEATVVSYRLRLKDGPEDGVVVNLWIDPVALTVLRREIRHHENVVEKTTRFDLNATFPPDHFEFQTAAMLLEARTLQVARAVSLHARYTGRPPKTLEDLKRRPADLPADVFWPDRGFWIGGDIPKDLAYAVEGSGFTVGAVKEALPDVSPVGVPSDRLRKLFNHKVTSALLKGAAHAYAVATTQGPSKPEDLLTKPAAARFWPEGGWIGGGKLPLDPWGEPYVLRAGSSFGVTLAKQKGRLLRPSELTAEERKGLETVAFPRLEARDLDEVKALIAKLGSGSLEEREGATTALIAKGGAVGVIVSERLAKEQDPEVASRLGLVAEHFQNVRRTWMLELKGLRHTLVGSGGDVAQIPTNEMRGGNSLRTIIYAQMDFRSNDRDGNRVSDFYARDVAGLYALKPAVGAELEAQAGRDGDEVLRLIEPALAQADATEGRWEYPILKAGEPQPYNGYFYASLSAYEADEKSVPYHGGEGRNSDRFGYVAYPAEYGVTGRRTYIVAEDNTVWQKDLSGEEVDLFPRDPAREGWTRFRETLD